MRSLLNRLLHEQQNCHDSVYLDSPRSLKNLTEKNMFQKPRINMHSSIIALCSMKDRQHIVLRWRQLESRRLRRHIGPTGRFEISASQRCMRSLFATRNINLVPDHDDKSEHFGKLSLKTASKDPQRDLARAHESSLDGHLWHIIDQAPNRMKQEHCWEVLCRNCYRD